MTKSSKITSEYNNSVSTAQFDEFMEDIYEETENGDENESSEGEEQDEDIDETENYELEDYSTVSSPKQAKPKATAFVLSLSQHQHEQLQSSAHFANHAKRGRIPVPWTSPTSVAKAKQEAKQQKKTQRRQSTGGQLQDHNNNVEQHVVSKEAVLALHCAATAAQTFETHFGSLKNPQRENTTPLYHSYEILTAEAPLRHLGFYTEYSLTGIRLGRFGRNIRNDDTSDNEDEGNAPDKQEAARKRFWERVSEKDEQQYYCVKYLQGGLMEATDHGGSAAADMIFETRILMNLTPQHPNICMVYGVNAGGIDTFLETTVKDGFFLITDKINELLPERIEAWRKKEKAPSTSNKSSSSSSSKRKSSSTTKAVSLSDRLDVALDISSALQFLHDRQIVYHIRPDKIGFEAKNEGRVKLCNFSQARYNGMREHQTKAITQSDDAVHILTYTAPEVLCKSTVTTSADVYGFGILLWEITALKHPYPDYTSRALHWEHVVQQHERPILNKKWNKELRNLMEACWHPYLRLEMHKIHESLEHLLLQISEDQQQDRMQKLQLSRSARAAAAARADPPLVIDRFAAPAAQHQKMPRRNSTGGALQIPTTITTATTAAPSPAAPADAVVQEKEEERSVTSSKKDKKSPSQRAQTRTSASSGSSRTHSKTSERWEEEEEQDNSGRAQSPSKRDKDRYESPTKRDRERNESPTKRDRERNESPTKRRSGKSSSSSSSKNSESRPESPRRQRPTVSRPGLQGRRVKSEKGAGLSAALEQTTFPAADPDAKSVSTSVSNARRSKNSRGSLQSLRDAQPSDPFSATASVSGGTVATSASSRRAKSPRRRFSSGHVPASAQRQTMYKHMDDDEEDDDGNDTKDIKDSGETNQWQHQFMTQQKSQVPINQDSGGMALSETSPGNNIATDRFGLHQYAVNPPDRGLFNQDDSQSQLEEEEPGSPSSPKSPMQKLRGKLKSMRGALSSRGDLPLANDADDDEYSKQSQKKGAKGMPHQIPEPSTASGSMLDYVKKSVFSKPGRRASVA